MVDVANCAGRLTIGSMVRAVGAAQCKVFPVKGTDLLFQGFQAVVVFDDIIGCVQSVPAAALCPKYLPGLIRIRTIPGADPIDLQFGAAVHTAPPGTRIAVPRRARASGFEVVVIRNDDHELVREPWRLATSTAGGIRPPPPFGSE